MSLFHLCGWANVPRASFLFSQGTWDWAARWRQARLDRDRHACCAMLIILSLKTTLVHFHARVLFRKMQNNASHLCVQIVLVCDWVYPELDWKLGDRIFKGCFYSLHAEGLRASREAADPASMISFGKFQCILKHTRKILNHSMPRASRILRKSPRPCSLNNLHDEEQGQQRSQISSNCGRVLHL